MGDVRGEKRKEAEKQRGRDGRQPYIVLYSTTRGGTYNMTRYSKLARYEDTRRDERQNAVTTGTGGKSSVTTETTDDGDDVRGPQSKTSDQ